MISVQVYVGHEYLKLIRPYFVLTLTKPYLHSNSLSVYQVTGQNSSCVAHHLHSIFWCLFCLGKLNHVIYV